MLQAARFRPVSATDAAKLHRYNSMPTVSTPQRQPNTLRPSSSSSGWRTVDFSRGRPQSANRATESKYVSYVKAEVPAGCRSLDALPVTNSTHARLEWQEGNRAKGAEERRVKETNEAMRREEQKELQRRVSLQRSASVGKVQASRETLVSNNKAVRRAEAAHEQHALAEKAVRLQSMRDLHKEVLRAKYKPVDMEQYRELLRFSQV